MSQQSQRERARRPGSARARGWIAGVAAVAVVATVGVISNGFDSRETPRAEPSVWVMRDAGQYARVNTETGEIDTVRKVSEPSGVVQRGADGVVLSHGNGQAWHIDAASPEDLSDDRARGGEDQPGAGDATEPEAGVDSEAAERAGTGKQPTLGSAATPLPEGAEEVIGAGEHLLVRTDTGKVFIGPDAGSLTQLDLKSAGESNDQDPALEFLADAAALDASGTVALYSSSSDTLLQYDIGSERFRSGVTLPAAATGLAEPELAIVSGDWVVFDAASGRVFRAGSEPQIIEIAGAARLQWSGEGDGPGAGGGTAALIADTAGLWRVPATGEPERIAETSGVPARPSAAGNSRVAAWIDQAGGTLWRSDATAQAGLEPLGFDEAAGTIGDPEPTFFSNGERAVLGETRSGMLWTLPEGRLIPLSQWTISDPPKEDRGTVVVDEVTEQVAPVAQDDAFGVRASEPAQLQVLLNDYDANKRDVLTIVPESLSESPLPEAFGSVELLPDSQSLMFRQAAGASGSASFSYRVTDGALSSKAATVKLTVVDDSVNTAPEWCPVVGCQLEWGVPEIAPGGTLVHPILEGWVDPEGDPMQLAGVEMLRPEDPARAMVTADGRLAVKHLDPNAGASEIMLRIIVKDAHGSEARRDLQVAVQPNAVAKFVGTAVSTEVGSVTTLNLLARVSGGSGSFVVRDVNVLSGSDRVRATAKPADGTVEIAAASAGQALLSASLTDVGTGAELTGIVRVTATDDGAPLTLPPLRAFVRPFADSTIEVLEAIPGAGSRALTVASANVVDGQLRAEVIDHSKVRVAGSTEDGSAGRIGAADVVVTEGDAQTTGRLTVFQVPEASLGGAIAVADTATVRAGDVVDIRVLDNDVSAPGERLVLHPEITGSGTRGELAFASGSVLRYLAPEKAGTYELRYTTYGASSPEASDTGTVTVRVIPKGANSNPHPRELTTRVSPGGVAEVRVPLSGVDPDGDRVRLTGVSQGEDSHVAAAITPAGNSISVSVTGDAEAGLHTVTYTVQDGRGGTGEALIRVIVAAQQETGAPIVSSDYVRVALGSEAPVTISPLDNDIDPAGGNLSILTVEPNLPGGSKHPDYARAAARIDLSEMKRGRVAVVSGDEPGTISYRYTVQSSASSSTADGLILVQTSDRVGSQAPSVTDTVMSVRDRHDLARGGVDVVADKVRWAAGDVAGLKLSLWEETTPGCTVKGNRILGAYKPEGDLVAFKLSGTDAAGAKVASYGFLIVPPLDDLRLTLRQGLAPLSVDENKTVQATVPTLVDVGAGDTVELKQTTFPVGRTGASCAATSPDTLQYSAGSEAPWSDVCVIDVRLAGQTAWTSLPVPVTIVPREPVVKLDPLTRTVSPGATEQIDLADMVRWEGNRAGDASRLKFSVSGSSSKFDVRASGTSVTVEARADATPGSQESLTVAVAGAGESRAQLVLRVGQLPRDTPRGATVELRCTVGSNCATNVIGAAGEYDPFAGKQGGGLKVESVSSSGCAVATVRRASDTGISVAWADDRGPGGRCTVGYTVRDAQGRLGEGSIELDAQGVPRAPVSVIPTGASADGVTLSVALNPQSAHPAVTGVELVTSSGAAAGSCSLAGSSATCTVTGLQPGKANQRTYYARAVNSVGASDRTANGATTWAYAPPSAPKVEATQVSDKANTSTTQGKVDVRISGSDTARTFRLSVGDNQAIEVGRRSVQQLPVGQQTLSVIPEDGEIPPGYSGSGQGSAGAAVVTVAGAPIAAASRIVPDAAGAGAATIEYEEWGQNHGPKIEYTFGLSREGAGQPRCTQSSPKFTGLTKFSQYSGVMCATTEFGTTTAQLTPVWVGGTPEAPVVSQGYVVAPDATGTGNVREYSGIAAQPVFSGTHSAARLYFSNGDVDTLTRSPISGSLSVKQCVGAPAAGRCSPEVQVTPRDGGPGGVRVTQIVECVPATGDPAASFRVEGDAPGTPTYTVTGADVEIAWPAGQWNPVTFQGAACATQ
ncbi:Ig-like domain-containing protein [Leucobacter sp. NPDC015123]|uniref:Ig-like domain-containing protein n=1 Tax=Leucobacter sp. NPDC015123 TaxID=3364129 RepID=UPI0036F46082